MVSMSDAGGGIGHRPCGRGGALAMAERYPGYPGDPGEARNALLPQLRVDELLDELLSRVTQIRATRDRIQQLLHGVLAVSSGLELDQVLQTIISTATELVDARYGALGVIDSGGGRPGRVGPVGLTPHAIEAVWPYPPRAGPLGPLVPHPPA